MTCASSLCHHRSVLVGRRGRLRWVYQILGGALLMPYYLLALVLVQIADPRIAAAPQLVQEFVAYGMALPIVAATAFFPVVRTLEVAAARALLDGPVADLSPGPAVTRGARWRTGVWYFLHLSVGGLVSGASLAIPPAAVLFIFLPVLHGWPRRAADSIFNMGHHANLAPVVGVGMLLALVVLAAGTGAGFARLAPVLLGPSPADRLAELERRTEQLAERNRLARELHDSVGHALSIVTVQAAAAGRVLDHDPAFARKALTAIEETARAALTDLDQVLGLLREERGGSVAQPALAELDRLLVQARHAGVQVQVDVSGAVERVPLGVSREAYRIVQEGLTNALRHAGAVAVFLRVDVQPSRLALELTNPLSAAPPGDAPLGAAQGRGDGSPGAIAGGHGLAGIAERVALLHGRVTAGPADGRWRLAVELPL
jgi:signal transduction histidine kinase